MLVLVGVGTDLTLDGDGTIGVGIPIGDGTIGIGVGITGATMILSGEVAFMVVFTVVGHTTHGEAIRTDIMAVIMVITDITATAVTLTTLAAEAATTIKAQEVV